MLEAFAGMQQIPWGSVFAHPLWVNTRLSATQQQPICGKLICLQLVGGGVGCMCTHAEHCGSERDSCAVSSATRNVAAPLAPSTMANVADGGSILVP